MKTPRLLAALSALFLPLCAAQAQQNTHMQIKMADGSLTTIPVADIQSIGFSPVGAAPALAALTGQWRLIAMPNGSSMGDIYTSVADTIAFTATVAPDGASLLCQADAFYTRAGQAYPAEWRVLAERDGDRLRLGWVLDSSAPASAKEFLEPREKYLDDGFFYWGSDDGGHRYIYLLSENIETQRLEEMTLWSSWVGDATASPVFTFPQNQEVYGVVATQVPFGGSVGYFDIWASPRFERP